ncbi:efflux RND transporter periplasmic adaptor subunit [Pradoshia sp.]
MSRKHYLFIILLVTLFVIVNIVLVERNGDVDRTVLISEPTTAKEKTLKKTFGTEGIVEPSSISHVYIDKDRGEIKSVLVEEGQQVEEGTPLIEYVDDSSQAEIETLEKANEELEIKKEKLISDRAVLEEEMNEAKSLPDIAGEEEGDNHVHPSYDPSRPIQYEINTIEYGIDQIELEIANNQAKIDTLKEASGETIVESEVAGIITKVHGDSRTDGEAIVTIASNNPLWAVAYVGEENIHRVEAGQTVMLYPEYLKAKRTYGTIIDVGIYPKEPTDSEGQSLYPVTIEIGEDAVTEDDENLDEQSVEDDSIESAEPVEEAIDIEVDGEAEEEEPVSEEESLETEAAPIRIGAHLNADITLEEMTGLTVHEKAVKYNKAIVLQKGKLKQQTVVIGLHADEQYVLAKGLKEKQRLLEEADLTIDTGTSYITMAKTHALTKKRIQQFSEKEFALLYLQGLLR